MSTACQSMFVGSTAYPLSAASARVRIGDFRPFLREQGVELTHRPALPTPNTPCSSPTRTPPEGGDPPSQRAADGSRSTDGQVSDGSAPAAVDALPRLDPPRHVDVYDIDDALFVGSPADANKRFQWVKQERRRAVSTMRRARW